MTNEEAAAILKTEDCDNCTFGGYAGCKCIGCHIKQAHALAIKALDNEKPQGEWKRVDIWNGCGEYVGGFVHINCPYIIEHDDGYYSPWQYNFCPNCGASMVRGVSDD